MVTRLQEDEYDEAGTHVGNFCENLVNVIRDQMGEPIQPRPHVTDFINSCVGGKYGNGEPDSIRLQLPRMLRATYDIRNNRDSVHVYLEVPVNRADTQTAVAMCSWMLAEVLREYGASDETDDMEEVAAMIDELSEPVKTGNPLKALETSADEFDRESLVDTLDGYIQIADGEIKPDQELQILSTKKKFIALSLGRLAANDLGHIDTIGAERGWFADLVDVSPTRIGQISRELQFVSKEENSNPNKYKVPGYKVREAFEYFND